ncbi:MAG: hypothetical protein Kow00123_26990 [Anaerolineales bacterium]
MNIYLYHYAYNAPILTNRPKVCYNTVAWGNGRAQSRPGVSLRKRLAHANLWRHRRRLKNGTLRAREGKAEGSWFPHRGTDAASPPCAAGIQTRADRKRKELASD